MQESTRELILQNQVHGGMELGMVDQASSQISARLRFRNFVILSNIPHAQSAVAFMAILTQPDGRQR